VLSFAYCHRPKVGPKSITISACPVPSRVGENDGFSGHAVQRHPRRVVTERPQPDPTSEIDDQIRTSGSVDVAGSDARRTQPVQLTPDCVVPIDPKAGRTEVDDDVVPATAIEVRRNQRRGVEPMESRPGGV
jgi:hypothetical protein